MGEFLNLQDGFFPGKGTYDIPIIEPVNDVEITEWIGFNYVKSNKRIIENIGVHFFLDDYQFERVWNKPNLYTPMLKRYKAVLSPDFSLYSDFPKAVQIFNHYRKHWLAALWQRFGLTVIPTIAWGDETSYAWCFDGEPAGGVVAVSSVGCMKNNAAKRLFLKGYNEMLARLQPVKIFFYGEIPQGVEGCVSQIVPFQERFKKVRNNGR